MTKLIFSALSEFEFRTLSEMDLEELNVIAIVQYHDEKTANLKLNCEFISTEQIITEIHQRKFSNFDLTEISPDFISKTEKEQIIALEMMLRIDPTKDMRFNDRRDIFNFFSAFWLKKLRALEPDAIYFGVVPHEIGDYILYVVANFLGVDTIINIEAYVLGRRRICESLEFPQITHPAIFYEEYSDSNNDLQLWLSDQMERKVRTYANWMSHITDLQSNSYENLLPLRFLKRFLEFFLRRKTWSRLSRLDNSKITQISLQRTEKFFGKSIYALKRFISLEVVNYERRLVSLDRVQRLASVSEGQLNSDFIVLFLHYQPEMLVSPTAGIFFDQIQNAAIIAAKLPKGWKLLVKEHPAQEKDSYGYNYLGRDPLFYSKLCSIRNVYLVSSALQTHELILKSRGVATISGTAGWQGLALSKPVLVFGNVWYGDAPHAHKVESEQDIEKFIKECEGINFSEEEKTEELFDFLETYRSSSIEMQSNEKSSQELGIAWDEKHNSINWRILINQICEYYSN
jgi:hypothetical protein